MKERPILFSAPMVRPILEGRKTQTRRVVKLKGNDGLQSDQSAWRFCEFHGDKAVWQHHADIQRVITEICPYGKPGDRLWVREAWAYYGGSEYLYQKEKRSTAFRATWDIDQYGWADAMGRGVPPIGYIPGGKWRPSIHMPRWASRITLEITDVRVQRLQEISEEDAISEGCKAEPIPAPDTLSDPNHRALAAAMEGGQFTAKLDFLMLWDSLNGNGASFANPWVWAITFNRR